MRLTDTQLVILSEASNRDDGIVIIPDRPKGGAATKAVGKLLKIKLLEEVPAAPGRLSTWRRDDEDGTAYALRITTSGLKAIGAGGDAKIGDDTATDAVKPVRVAKKGRAFSSAKTSAPARGEAAPAVITRATKQRSDKARTRKATPPAAQGNNRAPDATRGRLRGRVPPSRRAPTILTVARPRRHSPPKSPAATARSRMRSSPCSSP